MTKKITIKEWVGGGLEGGMLYNTYGLEPHHDMHPYNQALAQGVIPEQYGITHPLKEEFIGQSRWELITEIMYLRKELEEVAKAGFY